jgi:hypothetical protein
LVRRREMVWTKALKRAHPLLSCRSIGARTCFRNAP